MNLDRKFVRRSIRTLPSVKDYSQLMDTAKLTPIERRVCDLKYLKDFSMITIGEELGYSESGIKKIHQRVLTKLQVVL